MLPFSVRVTSLGWYGSFVGKKRKKKMWRAALVFFGLLGRKEIGGLLIMRGVRSKGLNFLSFVIFGLGLRCI